jgi:hypothetical protein
MQHFHGQLMQDGAVVLDTVAGSLQRLANSAAEESWAGYFGIMPGTDIAPGKYQLVLDDGRGETILIERAAPGNGRATVVHFKGAGMLGKRTTGNVVREGRTPT